MSLQPGINPLERIRTPMAPGMRTMEVRDQHSSYHSAEEMERRMKVDAFIDAIKQFEQPKDISYFKPVVFKNQEY